MTGDISRKTFDPDRDFSLVRMQQGRLFTDADWNEQGDTLRGSDRDTASDVIGHAGFPEDDPGFALIPDDGLGALVIGAGTGFVGGVRHVARGPAEYGLSQVDGNGASIRWRIADGGALADDDVVTTDPAGLADFVRVRDFAEDEDGVRTFRTTPALGAATAAVFLPVTYAAQPYRAGAELSQGNGIYLAVLKSTDQEVTALDDPRLREVAFDGPDTATRDRSVWQVQLYARDALLDQGFTEDDLTCPALAAGFDPVAGTRTAGAMRARAELSDLGEGPCTLPPAAGYRSLENRLYRVQIHRTNDEGGATYKWSRENAMFRSRYRQIDAGVLVMDSVGRDEGSALATDQWIEIRDQGTIHDGAPGFFARIGEVVGQRVSLAELRSPTMALLEDNGLPDTDALPREAVITRWDGGRPVLVDDALPDWVALESGIEVQFTPGFYQAGDHWTIPARAVTGDIEWPKNSATGAPLMRPAEGPRRDYAALGWLERDGDELRVTEDCRLLFPTLTRSKQVGMAGGDGQEALADPLNPGTLVPLPKVLSIAVTRGHAALAGERVRFRVLEGNGRFGNDLDSQIVETDGGGIASVSWGLDGATRVQRAFAQRLDAAGNPTHAPIAFNATLSRASHVSFDPANTPELGPATTVQKAIEALAGLQQFGCTTYVIQPGMDWVELLEGLGEDENASICFARGAYVSPRTVRMAGKGHIRISGAGPGTVQITANRVEAALAFEGFASVAVSGLEIATPDGNSAIPEALRKHRQGTLDFSHCDSVEVHGCSLRCGGGTSTHRTCLTSRGWSRSLKTFGPSRSVRITDNTLSVGNLQEGIVVTDAIDVEIAGNRLAAKPGRGGLGVDAFLSDKVWVARAAKSFIARPVKGNVAVGSGFKQIAGKEWRMTFNSPVSQKDWDVLLAQTPPRDQDLRNADMFTRYADRIIAKVVEEPDTMPSFRVHLKRLSDSFGTAPPQLQDAKVRRALLVSSEPRVQRFDAQVGKLRDVVVEANGQVVSFDSPFSERDWSELITRSEVAEKIRNADALLKLSQDLALRVLQDKELRAGLPSVEGWFRTLRNDGVSLGAQGIVCGGRRLDNVCVRGNRVRSFEVGVRVAVSHLQNAGIRARNVVIDDNRMELLARGPEAYAGYGLMVGNVDTLRICGNEMMLSDRPNFTRYFSQGIRIWGHVGHQILVAENRIAMATMGIRLLAKEVANSKMRLWVFRENLIRGPKGTRPWKVEPEAPLQEVHNMTLGDL